MLEQSARAVRPGIRERIAFALASIPSSSRRHLVLAHDILAAYASFLIAVYLRRGSLDLDAGLMTAHLLTPLFLLCFVGAARHYRMDQGVWRFASQSDFLVIGKVALISTILFYLALFLATRLVDVPRSLPLIHWLVLVFLLAGTRIAYVAWLTPQRAGRSGGPAPEWEPVLLLGAGQAAAILIDLFRPGASAAARLGVVGIIDDRTHYRGRAISGVPVLGQTAELGQIVARLAIHNMRPRRLVMTRSPDEFDPQSLQSLQEAALLHGILVQDAVELLRFGGEVERLATARPSLGTAQPAVRGSVWLVKRLIDIVAAAVLLVAASPAILATLLAVRVFLGSPMIFHQVRPGRHLAPFMLYKVRTLREGHLPDGRILDDELRQTRLGRFLRRSRTR